MRLRAPIWADRAAAKPFSGERDTLLIRGNRRNPLNGNPQRSVRERLHEISGLGRMPRLHAFVDGNPGLYSPLAKGKCRSG